MSTRSRVQLGIAVVCFIAAGLVLLAPWDRSADRRVAGERDVLMTAAAERPLEGHALEEAASRYGVTAGAFRMADREDDQGQYGGLDEEELRVAKFTTMLQREPPPVAGWQRLRTLTGNGTSAEIPGTFSLALAREAASSASPASELDVVAGPDGGAGLSGSVAPTDDRTLALLLQSAPVGVRDTHYAPPPEVIEALQSMAASAVSLVSLEPSAAALLGKSRSEPASAALAAAALAWPEGVRVQSVIAVPPEVETRYRPRLWLECERRVDRYRASIAALRRAYALTFPDTAGMQFRFEALLPYHSVSGWVRSLQVVWYLDVESGHWVLTEINSRSYSDAADGPWRHGSAPRSAQVPAAPNDPETYRIRLPEVITGTPIVAARGLTTP